MNHPWFLLMIFPASFCMTCAFTIFIHVTVHASILHQLGYTLGEKDVNTIKVSYWRAFFLLVLSLALLVIMVMGLKS